MESLIKEASFVVVDIETTGLSSESERVCEIAAVKIKQGAVRGKFSSLVNPGRDIPQPAVDIHGIDNSMVIGAPSFNQAWQQAKAFIQDLPVTGYNISFDIGFINKQNIEDGGRCLKNPLIDIAKISRFALKGLDNYRLETVAGKLNLSTRNAHRALADAETAAEVFLVLMPLLEKKGITKIKHLVSVFGIETDETLNQLNSSKISFLQEHINKRQAVSMDYFSFNAGCVYNWEVLPLEIEKKEAKIYLWAINLKDSQKRCFNLRRVIGLESLKTC